MTRAEAEKAITEKIHELREIMGSYTDKYGYLTIAFNNDGWGHAFAFDENRKYLIDISMIGGKRND